MSPFVLPANLVPEGIYAGGQRIAAFRGDPPYGSHQSEDWVASTTCCGGDNVVGLSRLPDGTMLKDAVKADPEKWLGREHIARYGADTKLLVKLLDAGQRLPVHAHPHKDWAKKQFGKTHGKAETWYILTPGTVHLGLKENISQAELLKLVESERGSELLDRMHKIDVSPHQTVYVPPGTLHAIGEGVFVVEVQEPEDMSVMCEWIGLNMDGRKDGHLGLGFETALTAVNTKAYTTNEIMRLVSDSKKYGSVCAEESREYFELERYHVKAREECRRGFGVVVVLDGSFDMETATGCSVSLSKGSTTVIAHGDGDFVLHGQGEVVIARPPD